MLLTYFLEDLRLAARGLLLAVALLLLPLRGRQRELLLVELPQVLQLQLVQLSHLTHLQRLQGRRRGGDGHGLIPGIGLLSGLLAQFILKKVLLLHLP